ncbi:MAG: hypothetical protein ACRC2T_08160 [Thermoguttaceae bacterium]
MNTKFFLEKNESDEKKRETVLSELQNSIFYVLFRKQLLNFTLCYFFVWGTAVLICRVSNTVAWTHLFWGGIFLALAPVYAFIVSKNKVPKKNKLGAVLDKENLAGGLIVASFETNIDEWNTVLPSLSTPTFKWNGKKTYILNFLAASFLLVTFLIPDSTIVADNGRKMNIDDQVNRLKGQLDTLAEEKILDIESVEARKMDLERIQKEAEGLGPVKTLDALDHLSNQLRQKADEAAEQGLKDAETLAKAETLTEQAQKFAENLSPDETKKLMDGLAETLSDMFGENSELLEKIGEQLGESGNDSSSENSQNGENSDKNGQPGKQGNKGMSNQKLDSEMLKKMLREKGLDKLSPEQLQQMKNAMQKAREIDKEMLQKLMERGMIDEEMLKKFENLEKVDEEELNRMLDELGVCEGCGGMCEGDCEGDGNGEGENGKEGNGRPGRGGRNRGRGDAPLRFVEKEADEAGSDFKSQVLPPPALEELKNSLKFGASQAAPDSTPDGTASDQGGAIRSIQAGAGSAHGQQILPQHRGATGRYFNREK